MTVNDEKVLGVVRSTPEGQTASEIARQLGLHRTSVIRSLTRLIANDLVRQSKTSHPFRYSVKKID